MSFGEYDVEYVKIESWILFDDIWITDDENFKADDGVVVYYKSELAVLAKKSQDDLVGIHEVKKVFGGKVRE